MHVRRSGGFQQDALTHITLVRNASVRAHIPDSKHKFVSDMAVRYFCTSTSSANGCTNTKDGCE